MLSTHMYYHAMTRNIVVAFGNLFSDMKIARKVGDSKNGVTSKIIEVPISYAPREKWLVRLQQDPSLVQSTYVNLPRMSFEILAFSYDPQRKQPKMNVISNCNSTNPLKVPTGAPYNLEIQLNILTKTQEDGLQIVEQILPYFAPDLTLRIKAVEEIGLKIDVPIVLNSVTTQDDYDGDFQTRRFVTNTLSFTAKTQYFGPISNKSNIQIVQAKLYGNEELTYKLADFTAAGEDESWTENG